MIMRSLLFSSFVYRVFLNLVCPFLGLLNLKVFFVLDE